MAQKRVLQLASRGKRLGAGAIDHIILTVLVFRFLGSFSRWLTTKVYYGSYGSMMGYNAGARTTAGDIMWWILMVAFIVAELYFMSRSQSIGKAILGLRVISSKDGYPLEFSRMLLRDVIVKRASSSVIYLGYIWILVDPQNRSWHDKIMDTYVIDERITGNPIREYRDPAASSNSMPPQTSPRTEEVHQEVFENLFKHSTSSAADHSVMQNREAHPDVYDNLRRNSMTTDVKDSAGQNREAHSDVYDNLFGVSSNPDRHSEESDILE